MHSQQELPGPGVFTLETSVDGSSQFAYLTVAIRRFYLAKGQGGRLRAVGGRPFTPLSPVHAFMTAVQVAGAAIALALI
jgi:hypothetical protein